MFNLSVEQESILGLAEALKYEDNGKALRRDLSRAMREAVQPALPEIRSGLMGMRTAGLDTESPRLRTAVLRQLKVKVKLSGAAGVRVSISKKGMPRGFTNAPKRLNSRKGWRHPVPRRRRRDGSMTDQKWVTQRGEPGYFDDPLHQRRREYRDAVMDAVETMRYRIRKGAR